MQMRMGLMLHHWVAILLVPLRQLLRGTRADCMCTEWVGDDDVVLRTLRLRHAQNVLRTVTVHDHRAECICRNAGNL